MSCPLVLFTKNNRRRSRRSARICIYLTVHDPKVTGVQRRAEVDVHWPRVKFVRLGSDVKWQVRSYSGGHIDKGDLARQKGLSRLNSAEDHISFLLAKRLIIGEYNADDSSQKLVS